MKYQPNMKERAVMVKDGGSTFIRNVEKCLIYRTGSNFKKSNVFTGVETPSITSFLEIYDDMKREFFYKTFVGSKNLL
jgi:hypothetical protein